MHRAVTADGHMVAQVAQIVGAGGTDQGWIAWLAHTPDELLGRYHTPEAAMAAADAGSCYSADVMRVSGPMALPPTRSA